MGKTRTTKRAGLQVEDHLKTLAQWKALSKEVLVLKCQALNLLAHGTVLTLANRLWNHYQQHGPSQASGSSFQSHASHGHSAIGPVVSS